MNHPNMKEDGFFRNRKPRRFKILAFDFTARGQRHWTHEMIRILLDLFFHFHEKRIIWEELEIQVISLNETFSRLLLHAVNTMNIFKKIDLSFLTCDIASEEHNDFCPGITSNKFIEELKINCVGRMSRQHCHALNTLLQTNTPCLQELNLQTNVINWILPGLRNNRTLKKVTLEFIILDYEGDHGVTDALSCEMVAAVTRIPSLESLCFKLVGNVNYGGNLTSEAFRRLLSESNSLRELEIYSADPEPTFNTECFIQGLKNSRSLKRFFCRNALYGDLIFARLFRILPDCPSLETLELSFGILTVEDFVQVKLFPRLPRPIILKVHKRRFEVDDGGVFAELLRYHPEVRLSYDSDWIDLFEDCEWHAVALNWHGRYLLDRPNVPLCIWSLVLEKVNRNERLDEKGKVSIIYELLKGPACGGRISF